MFDIFKKQKGKASVTEIEGARGRMVGNEFIFYLITDSEYMSEVKSRDTKLNSMQGGKSERPENSDLWKKSLDQKSGNNRVNLLIVPQIKSHFYESLCDLFFQNRILDDIVQYSKAFVNC